MTDRRREAARRVAAQYAPLPAIFAALRASLGEVAPPPAPPAEAPPAPPAEAPPPVEVPAEEPAVDALTLALVLEDDVREYAAAGAREARDAGVPGDADVGDAALDAVLAVLETYGDLPMSPTPDVLDRVRGVARSAGVVAAVRGTDWIVRQRFSPPYCARPACYGRDGSLLTDERVATEGLPPYGDGCTCFAEPTPG